MERTVKIELNRFPIIPNSLREIPAVNKPCQEVSVSLAGLYHQYYLDCYGRTPPNPDPAQFEYLKFLSNRTEFRILNDSLGISTAAKRHRSNELGQAFFRQFLHDHLGIIYFAHMEHVLNKSTHPAFGGIKITRTKTGDTPDYLCAENVNKVFLGEAKGRYDSIGFKTKEFSKWRKQFNRIEVTDKNNTLLSVKGYIVGTRFATEADSERIKTKVFAEDPNTDGEVDINEIRTQLGKYVITQHYANITEKLNLPLLAASLLNGHLLPEEIRIPVIVWEMAVGPYKGMKFVGGYYSSDTVRPVQTDNDNIEFHNINPFDLSAPRITFFGVAEHIFREVVKIARIGIYEIDSLSRIEEPIFFYSGASLLKDGSLIAPLEFLKAIGGNDY